MMWMHAKPSVFLFSLIILSALTFSGCLKGGEGKYQVSSSNGSAVLLDTQTGQTWTQVPCGQGGPMDCWIKMTFPQGAPYEKAANPAENAPEKTEETKTEEEK
jgi:hypothetical protein